MLDEQRQQTIRNLLFRQPVLDLPGKWIKPFASRGHSDGGVREFQTIRPYQPLLLGSAAEPFSSRATLAS